MSTSMDNRLDVFRCSIRAVPPLKTKGQPDRTRDSNRDKARMAFSTSAVSAILGTRVLACSIHSRFRLCGSIIVLRSYAVEDMLYLFFTVTASRIAQQPTARYVIIGECLLVNTNKFTSLKEFELRVQYDVHQHFFRHGHRQTFK